jgi:putative transcriptional regulator
MPNLTKSGYIMNTTRKNETQFDWSAADALTEEQIHAAALADPDAQPITDEGLKKMRPVPRTITIRRALKLSQEEFAQRFHIPAGTLRDWEQGRCEPDAAARAYLRVIAREPEMVRRALEPLPRL